MENITKKDGLFRKNGVSYLLSFIMITICFAMWGFANDVTNPMVKNFGTIFQISKFQSSFVQVAFYLGYVVMAFPAAMFKSGKTKCGDLQKPNVIEITKTKCIK